MVLLPTILNDTDFKGVPLFNGWNFSKISNDTVRRAGSVRQLLLVENYFKPTMSNVNAKRVTDTR